MTNKGLIDLDEWLKPHKAVIDRREKYMRSKAASILGEQSVSDFALGFQHFGLHKTKSGWVFREWAPNASQIFLVGEFNDWQDDPKFALKPEEFGQWSAEFAANTIKHGQKYKLHVYWPGGDGYRLPAYVNYVVQAEDSVDFSAVVWQPKLDYKWQHKSPKPPEIPLIYEAHVGMSGEQPAINSYKDFTKKVLPRVKKAGYNTVQLMAIPEHPYYGSFGYHVTNFFAASSKFGTPDEFKQLVDTAHGLGLRVILDLVHSHAAKNEVEGLSRFDGTLNQYFHKGDRGNHPAWDSRTFDYGKPEVMHFLLSNCRWWLDEYHVDGYRFDGVTSMIYNHHGLEKAFTCYDDYFQNDVDKDALTYLRLANQLVHDLQPDATTVAEEMSGLPGVAAPIDSGGLGFDYRLAMGTPDLWIKTLKEQKDEDWDLGNLVYTLHSHRPEEKVISYAESHDQALVGDKTLIFRLIDQEMYWHMQKSDQSPIVERGVALHKMIRLLTASTHGGGYLNFMGNEFGHPEWIDFPRAGNDWSYNYARRQWSLADNDLLRYSDLAKFDQHLTDLISQVTDPDIHYLTINQSDLVVSFIRNELLFIFNFSPDKSWANYPVPARAGSYKLILDSDDEAFGGHGRIDHKVRYFSQPHQDGHQLKTYLPARTAIVLEKID